MDVEGGSLDGFSQSAIAMLSIGTMIKPSKPRNRPLTHAWGHVTRRASRRDIQHRWRMFREKSVRKPWPARSKPPTLDHHPRSRHAHHRRPPRPRTAPRREGREGSPLRVRLPRQQPAARRGSPDSRQWSAINFPFPSSNPRLTVAVVV